MGPRPPVWVRVEEGQGRDAGPTGRDDGVVQVQAQSQREACLDHGAEAEGACEGRQAQAPAAGVRV